MDRASSKRWWYLSYPKACLLFFNCLLYQRSDVQGPASRGGGTIRAAILTLGASDVPSSRKKPLS